MNMSYIKIRNYYEWFGGLTPSACGGGVSNASRL
jgi:hypothetical protein